MTNSPSLPEKVLEGHAFNVEKSSLEGLMAGSGTMTWLTMPTPSPSCRLMKLEWSILSGNTALGLKKNCLNYRRGSWMREKTR